MFFSIQDLSVIYLHHNRRMIFMPIVKIQKKVCKGKVSVVVTGKVLYCLINKRMKKSFHLTMNANGQPLTFTWNTKNCKNKLQTNYLRKLTMDINCDGNILLFTHSIPSCTHVISSSLSLYINHGVCLSFMQHCLVGIFCPSNIWCWITSNITVKSEISSFKNSLINWSRRNHGQICIVTKSYITWWKNEKPMWTAVETLNQWNGLRSVLAI